MTDYLKGVSITELAPNIAIERDVSQMSKDELLDLVYGTALNTFVGQCNTPTSRQVLKNYIESSVRSLYMQGAKCLPAIPYVHVWSPKDNPNQVLFAILDISALGIRPYKVPHCDDESCDMGQLYYHCPACGDVKYDSYHWFDYCDHADGTREPVKVKCKDCGLEMTLDKDGIEE